VGEFYTKVKFCGSVGNFKLGIFKNSMHIGLILLPY